MNHFAIPVEAEGASRLPLRIADLVRNVDREPRIPDLTLADRLGFAKPHNVRKLIQRNRPELMLHGALVERAANFLRDGEKPAGRGRPGTMWFLNEGQALVVCALSRTPIAARVRQDVIAVYMAHRRGGDWLPPSGRERRVLRNLIDSGHVLPLDTPEGFEDHYRGEMATAVFLAPVSGTDLDDLAAFQADETDLEDADLDDEVTTSIAFGEMDTADEEETLGWSSNAGQLGLTSCDEQEHSLGWQDQGCQLRLVPSRGDLEADAGDEPEIENEHGDVFGH